MSLAQSKTAFVIRSLSCRDAKAIILAASMDEAIKKLEARVISKSKLQASIILSKEAATKYALPYKTLVIEYVKVI